MCGDAGPRVRFILSWLWKMCIFNSIYDGLTPTAPDILAIHVITNVSFNDVVGGYI